MFTLEDPMLIFDSTVLDDLEQIKIANDNRLRGLTRSVEDSDGEIRGYGYPTDHPEVVRFAAIVRVIGEQEHQAVLNLQRRIRKHPMYPWIKAQRGVGEKQAARLLAVIGDPYWNTLHNRPRTVSELWAYCGLHVLAAGGDSSQNPRDALPQLAGVAARRQKGQRANWSTVAKSRAYLISEAMLKAGNRETYDKRKAATEGRTHQAPCVRCGPKGKPALPGSDWSAGHRHADALRVQSKELLKGLWIEAKRLHDAS